MIKKPIIGLALGSGAARGLAHIGVLQALDENNIEVDIISGCSAGALIGSLYCCGITPVRISKIAQQLERKLWVDVTVPRRGFIKGDKAEEIVKILTRSRNIEELDKKLSIVATDLKSCKRFIFTEGPIYKAVRASISIPGVFVPVKYEDMVLVDGAVTDRVPASVVKNMGADIVIAVDVGFSSQQGRINHIFDVIIQSIDVMGREISANSIIHADVLIEPPVSHIGPTKFDMVEEGFRIGYEETLLKIETIKSLINKFKVDQ